MYIEDIIGNLFGIFGPPVDFFNQNELKFLTSFNSQIMTGTSLTEKQSAVVENIFLKHEKSISAFFCRDLSQAIANPKYKLGKRVINETKTIKVITNDDRSKTISINFPYNDELIKNIKSYKSSFVHGSEYKYITWNSNSKNWDFPFIEPHVSWIYQTFSNLNFMFDEEFISVAKEIEEIEKSVEKYVPMVIFENNKFQYVNTHKNIPQPTSTDLLEVLFDAKSYGINVWDESIGIALDDPTINNLTRTVLTTTSVSKKSDILTFTQDDHDFSDMADLFNYNNPVVFVIPGGSELKSLTAAHTELKNMGYSDDEMSVLFRLDSSTGKITNDYIKENNLNNAISEKIKIYFVSLKLPKPLIKNNVKIGTVVVFGNNSAHHTLRNFVSNHHNVLNYTLKKENNGNV
jgi:hypothetical protein